MYEAREHRDGTHYVVDRASGHLAHQTMPDGGQKAAVGMTEADAERLAYDLTMEAIRR